MRRMLEIICILLLTLAVLVAVCYGLGKRERKAEPMGEQPATAVTEAIRETPVPTEAAETEAVPTVPETQPEETVQMEALPDFSRVPRYYQTDYPHINFGNGTIATSGCSVTCLAMVASYLTEQEYTPDQMAYHFGRFGKNNMERLEYGNAQMQLPCEANTDWRTTYQALQEGKVVIAMVDERSCFTTAQHFIVLAGLTEEGRIVVNDPIARDESDVFLREGFAKGFREADIVAGFEGGWIYDKAAMADIDFRFDARKPEQQANRYHGYELPEEDIYTLACFAWAVAREESEEVQQAVLEVVLNRIVSADFPNTLHDVLHKSEFYSWLEPMQRAQPDFPQYRAVTAAMYGPYQIPENVYYFTQWEKGESWGKLGSFTFLHSR